MGWGWGAYVLPFVEQQSLGSALGVPDAVFGNGVSSAPPSPLTQTRLAVFLCPSDTGPDLNTLKRDHAKSNYRGICGPSIPLIFVANTDYGGVLFQNSKIRFTDIPDGTSNTLALGECVLDEATGHVAAVWVGMDSSWRVRLRKQLFSGRWTAATSASTVRARRRSAAGIRVAARCLVSATGACGSSMIQRTCPRYKSWPAAKTGGSPTRKICKRPTQSPPGPRGRHVGQPEVAAVVAVRQPLVIHAEQVQDRGVQVVDADPVLDGLVADLVGRAVACRP